MNLAGSLVTDIDAEVADRAFQHETIDDIRRSAGVEFCRSQRAGQQKSALARRLIAIGKRVIDDVLAPIRLVLINRVEIPF